MRLCLAIPTHDNKVYYEFMKSFSSVILYLSSQKIDYIMLHRVGSHINRSRNQIVSYFLASNCTHLLFLDSDISGFEYFVKKIVELERENRLPLLVGGIYPIKEYNWDELRNVHRNLDQFKGQKLTETQEKLYSMEFNINLLPDKKNIGHILTESEKFQGLYPVLHIPGGCMCVDRRVFTKLIAAYPNRKYDKGANEGVVDLEQSSSDLLYNFFDSFINDYDGNRQYLSEDYGFCELWTRTGGSIYADLSTTLGHFDGGHEYRGNYLEKLELKVAMFMKSKEAEEKLKVQGGRGAGGMVGGGGMGGGSGGDETLRFLEKIGVKNARYKEDTKEEINNNDNDSAVTEIPSLN